MLLLRIMVVLLITWGVFLLKQELLCASNTTLRPTIFHPLQPGWWNGKSLRINSRVKRKGKKRKDGDDCTEIGEWGCGTHYSYRAVPEMWLFYAILLPRKLFFFFFTLGSNFLEIFCLLVLMFGGSILECIY